MQPGNCQTRFAPILIFRWVVFTSMETRIDFERLRYTDLIRLGELAAEAMALSQEYDRSRSRVYCQLIAACNVEMLTRRSEAVRHCGTAL